MREVDWQNFFDGESTTIWPKPSPNMRKEMERLGVEIRPDREIDAHNSKLIAQALVLRQFVPDLKDIEA